MSAAFEPTEKFGTFVELLRWRAAHHPERLALTFLQDGEAQESSLTYGQLDQRARALAARLQKLGATDERALLLYPAGLDFIVALLGCFYARTIAVPAYPPHFNRPMPRLQAISTDAQASLVLTTSQILSSAATRLAHAPQLQALRWIDLDGSEGEAAGDWQMPEVDDKTLAFLQYTSGSTNMPKGVMVSHGNLMANERMIRLAFDHTEQTVFVLWLPLYHDMGLIGNVLQSLYTGGRAIMMSPTSFLQRPFRWLEAISRYRAHTSGAPNFAYQLCVDRITPEERTTLDLSSWTLAFNGAEPVRQQTLERFTNTFAARGFRAEAFYPCYGLAEATVFVSGGKRHEPPVVGHFSKEALARNLVRESSHEGDSKALVSCGRSWLRQNVMIVNPDTLAERADAEIGEVWVSGPHIAQGYWNRPEQTGQIFPTRQSDSGPERFLRTGDLGFLQDGELFITGRLKDLIIIRGRNHYPQDIEATLERSHPALRPAASSAFSVEEDGEERLVLVAEVRRHFQSSSAEEVFASVRRQVAEEHDLEVHAILLLKTSSIPKTTSGKIQRQGCRAAFLNDSLSVISRSRRMSNPGSAATEVRETVSANSAFNTQNGEAIRSWLISRLAVRIGAESHSIDPLATFSSYGLDSAATVTMTAELAAWLGRELAPTMMYEHPNIAALSEHLAVSVPGFQNNQTELRAQPGSPAGSPPRRVEATKEPIALIGIGCRFPGAYGPIAFWRLLRDGIDAITEVPRERWDARAFYTSRVATPGKMNTRWGGFLEGVDQFDASFFGIAPREAVHMDPQQRLLLETAWEALEDAGQVAERLAGSATGIFVGLATSEYASLQLSRSTVLDAYGTTGSALSIAANRLSYFFDFRGPSMTIDTACSSSLVAVHLACQSIWNGECSLALAGGANLILSPAITIGFSQAGATSPQGRCHAFSALADGIVRSEGVGLVVLKPLSEALAHGDEIYAVIRGSAVTQDGRSNGITAPSGPAQEETLQRAYRSAGVSPGRVHYVETHGTGTLLGDPIEANALGHVLAMDRVPGKPCAIGSVKANIGHSEAAAGIASLIKVALALKHRVLPPSLHSSEPNPHIDFSGLQLRVQQSLEPWPDDAQPALAGVSAFGFGGTNAHVVLEEAPPSGREEDTELNPAGRIYLLPLSAHSSEALQSLAQAYKAFLSAEDGREISCQRICETASMRRSHHAYRLAILAHSREELIERLQAFGQGETRSDGLAGRVFPGQRRKLVFVCSGYGGQWWAMCRDLLKHERVFRTAIAETEELLCEQGLEWSLIEELLAEQSRSRLEGNNIEITQIALFSIQVALAALWRSWGIVPDAVVGHSLGEVAAAQIAGILSLKDAVRVICNRSRLMERRRQQLEVSGAMAVLDLPIDEARRVLTAYEDSLSVAVHNAPGSVVLAGEAVALAEALARSQASWQMLTAPGGGHSPQVDCVKDQLTQALQGLRPQSGTIPMYSTVTGDYQQGKKFDAAYWGLNVRKSVLFAEAMASLSRDGFDVFIELSPLPILSPAILQNLKYLDKEGIVLPSLRRRREDRAVMMKALANLYVQGFRITWEQIYGPATTPVRVPVYTWQRARYWVEEQPAHQARSRRRNGRAATEIYHPLLGEHVQSAAHAGTHLWEMELDAHRFASLGEHRLRGRAFFPPAAYMEMALAAAGQAFGMGPHVLEDVDFEQALALPEAQSGGRTMQLVLANVRPGLASFQFFSMRPQSVTQPSTWVLHAQGKIRLAGETAATS